MSLKLNIIIASTRPGRGGPAVANWVFEQAKTHDGFDVALIDLQDFNLPLLDEPNHPAQQNYTKDHTKRWSEVNAQADAFLFVTPEYDYFPPASLVNALQCLSAEWRYKVGTVVSYGGVSGGLRSTQALRQLLGNLNMMAIPQGVPISFYRNHFENDEFVPTEPMKEGLVVALNELHKWGQALQRMR